MGRSCIHAIETAFASLPHRHGMASALKCSYGHSIVNQNHEIMIMSCISIPDCRSFSLKYWIWFKLFHAWDDLRIILGDILCLLSTTSALSMCMPIIIFTIGPYFTLTLMWQNSTAIYEWFFLTRVWGFKILYLLLPIQKPLKGVLSIWEKICTMIPFHVRWSFQASQLLL